MIYQGTHYVLNDEPCLGLYELHLKSPDQRSRRRYQILVVLRNGKPAEHRIDLGPTSKFKNVEQIIIPGGVIDNKTGKIYIEETVGRLKDYADKVKLKPAFDKMDLALSGISWKREPAKIYSYKE